jgi:divalent metal cation (Fe/Co/Zn/Cd) transporter
VPHERCQRAIWAAFLANLCVAVAKFVAFLFTGAAAPPGEALHSVADTGNQLLLLLGAARVRRPPSASRWSVSGSRLGPAIREVLESHPQLLCLIHLRTQHLGPDEFLVAAKVELDPSLSLPDAARVIDEGQARVRERAPAARVIYIEPDVVPSGGEAPLTQ